MHAQYTLLMSLALDDQATAAQKADLQRHLTACSSCAAVWARWRALDLRLAAAPRVAPPPNFVAEVAARLEKRRLRQRRWRWIGSGVLMAWVGIAGALGLCVAGLLVWGLMHPLEGSLLAAWGARLLSSLAQLLGVVQGCLSLLGGPVLGLGAGFYVILTTGLAALWLWLVIGRLGWARPAVPVVG
jgi:anti-sigma factor RsiW